MAKQRDLSEELRNIKIGSRVKTIKTRISRPGLAQRVNDNMKSKKNRKWFDKVTPLIFDASNEARKDWDKDTKKRD